VDAFLFTDSVRLPHGCVAIFSTVGSILEAGGCNTMPVSGLTAQIVSQLSDIGHKFASMAGESDIHLDQDCQPFLQAAPLQALHAATKAKHDFITLSSAFRSSAQQYLLYEWYKRGQCSIQIAAVPGTHHARRPACFFPLILGSFS
jgi:hypothetical protein